MNNEESILFPIKEQFMMFAAIMLCPFVAAYNILFPPSKEEIERRRKIEREEMRKRHYQHDRKLDGVDLGRP